MRLVFKRFEVAEPRTVNSRSWSKQALHNKFRDYLVENFSTGWTAGFCIRLPKGDTVLSDNYTILTTRRSLFIALVKS